MSRLVRQDVITDLVRAWRASRLQTDLLDDAAFAKLGINRTDGRCLDALSQGPMTSAVLARACGVTPNALTTVVDRLAAKGLVERYTDPSDRRRVQIRLTPLADHLSQQLYGPVIQAAMRNLNRYTAAQLQLITEFLDQSTAVQAQRLEQLGNVELFWEVPRE